VSRENLDDGYKNGRISQHIDLKKVFRDVVRDIASGKRVQDMNKVEIMSIYSQVDSGRLARHENGVSVRVLSGGGVLASAMKELKKGDLTETNYRNTGFKGDGTQIDYTYTSKHYDDGRHETSEVMGIDHDKPLPKEKWDKIKPTEIPDIDDRRKGTMLASLSQNSKGGRSV